jgi:hypothetical protein
MEISLDAIRRNFKSKSDTELLDLADSNSELTSEARILLLQELNDRLEKARESAQTIQLNHGWYLVATPTAEVRFPEFCPRCSRAADGTSLRFLSQQQRKFRFLYWKTTRAVSNVPHCSVCVAELKRSRAICSWTWGIVGFLSVAAAVWLRVPRYLIYLGLFVVSAPFVYLYDRTSAVKLGEFNEGFVEYRFRSHAYAKAFALLNNVQSENAETLQVDLQAAISHINS